MGAQVVLFVFCKEVASCKKNILPILAVAMALAPGCATTKPLVSDPRSIWCEQNEPRRDAKEDTPRAELDDINATNARGVKWCGWTP